MSNSTSECGSNCNFEEQADDHFYANPRDSKLSGTVTRNGSISTFAIPSLNLSTWCSNETKSSPIGEADAKSNVTFVSTGFLTSDRFRRLSLESSFVSMALISQATKALIFTRTLDTSPAPNPTGFAATMSTTLMC